MVAPTIISKGRLAVKSLRDAEDSAVSGSSDSVENNGGYYTGKGKDSSNAKKGKFNKTKKRIATLSFIAILMIGGGTFLGTTNFTLGGAIEALFTNEDDTQFAPFDQRTNHLIRYAVQGDEVIKTNKWTGTKKYGKISSSFKKRLAQEGITIEGKGRKAKLVFTYDSTDSTGKTEMKTKTIPADEFSKTIKSDADFREAFQTARRGRIATFFDNTATAVLKKLGITRNLFKDYKNSSDEEANTKNFRQTMADKFEDESTSIKQKGESEVDKKDTDGNTITDSEGKPVKEKVPIDVEETAKTSGSNVADAETKAKNMLDGVASKFTAVGSWSCTITRVMSMISVVVAANEIYQSINYFMGFSENISKMMAGRGDASAINEVMNFLSTTSTTETNKYGKLTITENTSGNTGSITGGKNIIKQTGSPLEDNGMQMVLAGSPLSSTETELFSLERLNNSASSKETENKCAAVDGVSAVVSIGVTIASLGTSTIVSTLWSVAKGAAGSIAISVALSFIIPTIAEKLFTNAFETASGIPAGALFAMGAAAALTRLGRNASGQSLSSKAAALAQNKINQEVIAMEAEIDRKNLSPFDASNKNTFLGSIAYSLLPLATSSKITNLSSLLTTTSKSLASLIGNNVSANGEGTSYMTKFGKCETLEKIGAKGDVYCNPITSTDVDTINMSPDDDEYQKIISNQMKDGSCQEDGSGCEIKSDGDLAKYITYCANRDSPFGVVDQNILGELQSSGGLGAFRGIVGAVPLVGDALDIADTAENQKNMPWATGERCGNTDNNSSFWNSKGQYYQRFIEDTRILKQFGAYDDDPDPISLFNKQYETEHPTDNTYIGYMSRISGLLPENVETTLAFLEYYQYLDEYNPNNRVVMADHPSIVKTSDIVITEVKTKEKQLVEHPAQVIEYISAILQPEIIYADTRNRSFTI